MPTVGRLKDGNLIIAGELNERLPPVANGLVAHFPFDDRGGTFDMIGGHQPIQHTVTGVNLVEAMNLNWRDPDSWQRRHGTGAAQWDEGKQALKFTGHYEGHLKIPIVIDYNKHYLVRVTYLQESMSATNRLYLGGYSALPNGLSFNGGGWDYSLGVALVPVLNQWHSASITRYSTASYPSGWTGSAGLAVKHYFGGLFNYNCQNTTDTIYISDISIVVTDADNSNCTMTSDGIAIEEATTNLVPNPGIFSSGWVTYSNGNDGAFMTEFGTEGLNIINRRSWCGAYRSITLPAAGTYTLSVLVKVISRTQTDIGATLYTSGGGISDTLVSASWDPDKIGKWQKISMTRTYTATNISLFLICYGGSSTAGYEITAQYTMPQIEQKPFVTSFVSGSRGHGYLELPIGDSINSIDRAVGSLVMTLNPTTSIYSTTSYIDMVDARTTANVTNRFVILRKSANSDSINEMYLRNGSVWVAVGIAPYVRKDAENTFVWTWENGAQYAMYVNGTKVATGGYATANTNLDKIIFQHNMVNLKDVSVYNRALTDDEVAKFIKNPLSVDSKGSLSTAKLIERPSSIPAFAIYFPFGSGGRDYNGVIAPATESGVAYEGGTVWVGAATTNIQPDPHMLNGMSGKGSQNWSGGGVITVSDSVAVLDNVKATQGLALLTYPSTVAGSGPYTFSMRCRSVSGNDIAVSNYLGVSYKSIGTAKASGEWVVLSAVYNNGEYTTNPTQHTLVESGCKLEIDWIQIENKSYRTPFVAGTRSHSSLSYNFSSWIKDWQEFSIVMWIRYSDASRWRLSGAWTKFYFGLSPNSKVCFSWVENGAQRGAMEAASPVPINQWVMIGCSIKNNAFIDLYYNGKRDLNWDGAFQLNGGASNFELNDISPGYAGYPLNAYVRDFIILPRALTPEEMANIYKTQMRSYQDGSLQIQADLTEKVVL